MHGRLCPPEQIATPSERMPAAFRSSRLLIVWHVLVVAAVLVVPAALEFHEPFWRTPGLNAWIVVAVFGVDVAAHWIPRVGGWAKPLGVLAAGVAIVAGVLLLVPHPHFSRLLLVVAFAIVAAHLLAGPFARLVWRRPRLVAVCTVVGVALSLSSYAGYRYVQRPRPQLTSRVVQASQHTLRVNYYHGYFPAFAVSPATGGAIAPDPKGGGYYIVTAHGDLFRFSWANDDLSLQSLGLKVPINYAEFAAGIKPTSSQGFRVADMAAVEESGATVLYVSHHYWKDSDHCFVLRLSRIALSGDPAGDASTPWQTVFETSPCLKVEVGRGSAFAGEQAGGNIERIDTTHLLLTVGDHQFDGWYKPANLIQDLTASYGKTLLIDTTSGKASIFTIGHRNPQGLVVDGAGRIWETEHGPQGGDELNLLTAGGNYGYPVATFGTDYGSVTWPPSENRKPTDRFIDPVYAWVPSIGISDLVFVHDPKFPRWDGDLLIASLTGRSLWRVLVEDQRVVYAEPITIGKRIRDVAAGAGEFVLWTDDQTIVRVRPAEMLDTGAALFEVRCAGCHDDVENRIGPTLGGVLGRRIGSGKGYAYSVALIDAGGRWTSERLKQFLADRQFRARATSGYAGDPRLGT